MSTPIIIMAFAIAVSFAGAFFACEWFIRRYATDSTSGAASWRARASRAYNRQHRSDDNPSERHSDQHHQQEEL